MPPRQSPFRAPATGSSSAFRSSLDLSDAPVVDRPADGSPSVPPPKQPAAPVTLAGAPAHQDLVSQLQSAEARYSALLVSSEETIARLQERDRRSTEEIRRLEVQMANQASAEARRLGEEIAKKNKALKDQADSIDLLEQANRTAASQLALLQAEHEQVQRKLEDTSQALSSALLRVELDPYQLCISSYGSSQGLSQTDLAWAERHQLHPPASETAAGSCRASSSLLPGGGPGSCASVIGALEHELRARDMSLSEQSLRLSEAHLALGWASPPAGGPGEEMLELALEQVSQLEARVDASERQVATQYQALVELMAMHGQVRRVLEREAFAGDSGPGPWHELLSVATLLVRRSDKLFALLAEVEAARGCPAQRDSAMADGEPPVESPPGQEEARTSSRADVLALENRSLRNQLSDHHLGLGILEGQLLEAERRKDELASELRRSEGLRVEFAGKLEDVQQQHAALTEELHRVKEQHSQAQQHQQEQHAQMAKQLEQSELQCSGLMSRLDTSAQGEADLAGRVGQLEAECAALQRQRQSLDQDLQHAEGRYQALAREHDDLVARHGALADQYAALVSQHDELTQTHTELTQTHEELTQTHEELSKAHAELSKAHEELSKTHEELSKTHAELTERHANLFQQHAAQAEQHTSLASQHESLSSQHGSLVSQHASLSDQHAALLEQHQALVQEHQQADALIGQLKQQQQHLLDSLPEVMTFLAHMETTSSLDDEAADPSAGSLRQPFSALLLNAGGASSRSASDAASREQHAAAAAAAAAEEDAARARAALDRADRQLRALARRLDQLTAAELAAMDLVEALHQESDSLFKRLAKAEAGLGAARAEHASEVALLRGVYTEQVNSAQDLATGRAKQLAALEERIAELEQSFRQCQAELGREAALRASSQAELQATRDEAAGLAAAACAAANSRAAAAEAALQAHQAQADAMRASGDRALADLRRELAAEREHRTRLEERAAALGRSASVPHAAGAGGSAGPPAGPTGSVPDLAARFATSEDQNRKLRLLIVSLRKEMSRTQAELHRLQGAGAPDGPADRQLKRPLGTDHLEAAGVDRPSLPPALRRDASLPASDPGGAPP
ncbi:hypothetical protein H696_04118 [Fonticula alba]|uniref:Uncharacterized protein n=1 Tax=Fonticula alba TaxID=691883 RepID=A0A058Z6F7_FONAL|nr:hypothetical protein H696_04118 [Fonticula alba]KCV69711.1 hypothetical protein H696_04118 [Fonticula alba]|eukprot:XP_009496276.1 hypothetical protein H696_04118 [Fonticula alba]